VAGLAAMLAAMLAAIGVTRLVGARPDGPAAAAAGVLGLAAAMTGFLRGARQAVPPGGRDARGVRALAARLLAPAAGRPTLAADALAGLTFALATAALQAVAARVWP
jgi:hypothetical protein